MGWSDDHLHRFRIHGKQYGIARMGGLSFSDDPDTVRLKDFHFRINECFRYEYDFTDDWQHQVRVEDILAPGADRIILNVSMVNVRVRRKIVVVR